MAEKLRLLIVEDSEDDALLLTDLLKQNGFDLAARRVQSRTEMRQAFEGGRWDIVISDYVLPSFGGMEALKICRELNWDMPFIFVSGSMGEDIAVEAMRLGAHDYVLKDRLARLPVAVARELREAENRKQKRAAEEERDRQAKQLAIRAEQLERANRDLERFAFISAHDLQEPTRMVGLFSQMLARKLVSRDEETEQILGYIAEGVRRMQELLDGLLAYSQAFEKLNRERGQVNTRLALKDVLYTMAARLEQAGAKVSCGFLPTVRADHSDISQLFESFLSNALKYRKRGVEPSIRIEAIERDDEWMFSVSDNGIGIERENLEKIFLIFARLHKSSEYPGAGVGLALAKRLVESYGGRIWVESQPGEGSIFYFTIPKP